MHIGLVQAADVLSPAPILNACRVDAFYAVGLVGPHHPGDIGGGLLNVTLFQVTHDEPVVAQDHVSAHIQNRSRAHLLMSVSGFQGRHRRLEDCGIAHGCVVVALLIDRGDSVAAAGMSECRLFAN